MSPIIDDARRAVGYGSVASMSALGHKQTSRPEISMSALPRKQKLAETAVMSAVSRLMHCSKEPCYSIISSAAVNNLSGMVSPSALAVLRLMISSYFVGTCTGRSAGFHKNANQPHPVRLLRKCRERPSRYCAADERDEFAPPHSITSSAVASRDCGKVRPSAFAAFKFSTSCNFVGRCTGSSAGLAPLKIWPA